MKRAVSITGVCFLLYLIVTCAGGVSVIKPPAEPIEGRVLIIGNVLFEVNNYNNIREVDRQDIDVGVIGIYEENGKKKEWGKWAKTDSLGYFFIANAPEGKFELKAVRLFLKQGGYTGFSRPYRSAIDNFTGVSSPDGILLSGVEPGLITTAPLNRIVNLRINYITVLPNGELRPRMTDKVENLEMITGEIINTPLIFDYFLECPAFQNSGWLPFLKAESNKYIH